MRGFRPIAAAAALALVAGPAAADGDTAKGKSGFGRCVACHALEKGSNRSGPSLHCIVGRTAAAEPGYRYSRSLKALGKSGFAWDEASLFAYLADPRGFLKKQLKAGSVSNKMLLRFPNEAFRRDVIAYLKAAACK